MLPTASAHIEFAAGGLEEPAHLFHALERGGLAGLRHFRAGQARFQEAVGGLVLFGREILTSCVIFIEQNLGPHMEQKCALLAPSAGSVWS